MLLGFVLLVELASFTTIGAAQGKTFTIGGHVIDTTAPLPWVLALAALVVGALWLRREARGFRERWDALIEDAKIKARYGVRRRRRCREPDVALPAVELRDVRKSFGRTEIIRGVNLDIPRGERHAIIGPNGAGKTTLFNLISGRFPLSSGIDRGERPIDRRLAPHEINRLGLSRSFQITSIFPRMTRVREHPLRPAVVARLSLLVLAPAGAAEGAERGSRAAARAAEPADRRNVPAGLLSYAEQRALEIGITIAGGAEIILLDEPTAGMSHSETEHAVALIRTVSEGKTLVMVEHDMSVVFGLADRITVLVYGEVIAVGRAGRDPRQRRGAGSLSRHGGGMMLEVRDLHAYYGKSHILQGVDLAVGEGEIVSLLGRNGVGRSTTCKAIMGLVPPVGADRASRAGRSPGCGPTRSPMSASATCRRTARSSRR